MKINKITINNIGCIGIMSFEINKPLIIFYGEIMQGKTTILNSFKWLAGGVIPKNIIKKDQKEGFIEIEVENGIISRSFYLNENNILKPRPIDAIINNKKLSQKEVALLFNPFLLDQDFFKNKNSIDKSKFLLEIFNVDTSFLDDQKKNKEQRAKEIRAAIKAFGEIDITEVKQSNINELRNLENKCRERLNIKYLANKKHNEILQANYNNEVSEINRLIAAWGIEQDKKDIKIKELNELNANLVAFGYVGNEVELFINSFPKPEKEHNYKLPCKPTLIEELPDQTELTQIQEEISKQGAQEVLYNNYLDRLEKQKQKDKKNEELKALTLEIKNINIEKAELLKTISGSIQGLEFNDNGDFSYMGTASDMLSDSQQIDLSNKLSLLYKNGFEIALIDRGESMGKSVFKLAEEAQENNRNILVTVVGDKPAEIPENIGVFVVENGELK